MDEVKDTVLRIPIGTASADVRTLMEMMVLQNKDNVEQRRANEEQRRGERTRDRERREDLQRAEEHRREDLLIRAASTAALKTQNDLTIIRTTKPIRMGVDIPQLAKLEDPSEITLFLDCFKRDMIRYDVPRPQW